MIPAGDPICQNQKTHYSISQPARSQSEQGTDPYVFLYSQLLPMNRDSGFQIGQKTYQQKLLSGNFYRKAI